ncbi:MAG: glycosyltransferase family 39 protein [Anaerolineae bacterium]
MKRRWFWLAVLVLLLASALRFAGLGTQELSGDEAFSVFFSEPAPRDIVSAIIRGGEPHPPVYWIILHGTLQVAGSSEFAVRFPSAVASILTVALVFALGRRMFGPRAGLAAAAFVAFNPFQIWYAQTARMYALSTALAVATTLALWTAFQQDKWRHWAAYAVLTAAHAFEHYVALFVALAQGVWVLLAWWRDRRRLFHFALACLGVGLLCLPWVILVLPAIQSYYGNGDSPALGAMLVRCLRVFSLGETMQPAAGLAFATAFGLLFAFGLIRAARTEPRGAGLLVLWLFLPLAAMWIASRREPVFDERYVIVATPPFLILVGLGAAGLARKSRWGPSLAGLLLAACLVGMVLSLRNFYVAPAYTRTTGWREVAGYLESHATENDLLIQNYPDPTLSYYVRGSLPLVVVPQRAGAPPEQIARTLTDLTEEHDRIWFLPYPHPGWDASGAVGQWLDNNAELVEEVEPGGLLLRAYLPLDVALKQMTPVEAWLGSNIRLLGYQLEGNAQPGGTLHLTLYWEALGAIDTDYTVFTHLLGVEDAMLGQLDHPPQNGAAPTSTWQTGERLADPYQIPIQPDAPAGPARLVVGMYDPATGDRLRATGPVDEFDRIYLTEIEIETGP